MGVIYDTARRLADEGNSISVILAAIQSMESGAAPPRKGKDGSPRCELERVLDPERAQAVLDHRQRKRAALTPLAARLLAAEFEATGNPSDAADLMILMGWQGFKVAWYEKERRAPGTYQPIRTNAIEERRQALQERVSREYGIGRDRGAGAAPAGQLSFAGE